MNDEFDFLQIAAGALEMAGGEFLLRRMPDEEADGFARRNFARHFAIDPADGFHFARPVAWWCGQASHVAACGSHSAGMA